MAKCSECGGSLVPEAKFCPKCGAPTCDPSPAGSPASADTAHKNEMRSPAPNRRPIAAPPPRMARAAPPKLPQNAEKYGEADNQDRSPKSSRLILGGIVLIAMAAGAFWQRDVIFGTADPAISEISNVGQSASSSSSETPTKSANELPTVQEDRLGQTALPEQTADNSDASGTTDRPGGGSATVNMKPSTSGAYYGRQREGATTDRPSPQQSQSIFNIYNKFLADTAEDNREISRSISRLNSCGINAKGDYTYNLKMVGDYYLIYSGPFNDPMDALRERQLASSCGIKSRPESVRR